MAETLLIRFASNAAASAPEPSLQTTEVSDADAASSTSISEPIDRPIEWLLADPQGGRLSNVMQAPLAEVAGLAAGRHVVVIVPGSEVLLAELDLPAKNAARLQQMVPFALEEQLAGDIEDMHFAIGKRIAAGQDKGQNKGKTPVAAVTHQHMQTWMADLARAGLVADALYPESMLLPPTPRGSTLLIDGNAIHVRTNSPYSTSIEAQPFGDTLQLALPTETSTPVTVYVSQLEYESLQTTLDAAREPFADMQIKLLAEGALPLLALQISRVDDLFSLQQGPYQRVKAASGSAMGWRIAAGLALVAVLLHGAYHGTQWWHFTRQEKQLDEQIISAVSQALPGNSSKDVSMARTLVESRLLQLQKSGGASPLLSSLNTLSQAIAQTPGTQIESLAYSNKTLNLRLNAPSVDSLDQLRTRAQAGGLQSELQATTPRDKSVEGRLQLKSPGA